MYDNIQLKIQKISDKAKLPVKGTIGSAGLDLFSAEEKIIPKGEISLIKTGLIMEIPENYYGKIYGRSSIEYKKIFTKAGVIDRDYRGEIKVMLFNCSGEDFRIEIGDRIAQLLILSINEKVEVKEIYEVGKTDRGEGGFGSTGK